MKRASSPTALRSPAARLLVLARNVLDALERWEPLSHVLPQARAMAEFHGSRLHAHWLDNEIYGLGQAPHAKASPEIEEERQAIGIFLELHSVIDVASMTELDLARLMQSDELQRRDAAAPQSIAEIELTVEDRPEHHHGHVHLSLHGGEHGIRPEVMRREQLNILQRVRSYLYDYVHRVWLYADQEVEAQRLLGPDYRLAVYALDGLVPGLGQELLAALALVRSDEPDQWQAAGLVCQGVLRKLGQALFLDASSGDEDKLVAFIKARGGVEGGRQEMEELAALAVSIGGRAAGRGAQLRRAQAEGLLADTFRLIDSLEQRAGLEPIAAR